MRLYKKVAEKADDSSACEDPEDVDLYGMAQCCLGTCYEKGHGVEKDCAEAVKWYKKAVARGDEYAKKALADLLE